MSTTFGIIHKKEYIKFLIF